MKKITIAVLTVLMFSMLICTAIAADGSIVPGKRIGKYVLWKTSMDQVKKSLGKPDKMRNNKVGDFDTVILQYNKERINFQFRKKDGKLFTILTGNKGLKTAGGVTAGSTMNDVKAEFGKPDSVRKSPDGKFERWHYKKGIGFMFHKAGKRIIAIHVSDFKPLEKKK